MACAHTIFHSVNFLELPDPLERLFTEWSFVLKSMQHNSLQQVAQGNIVIFSNPFENLHHSLLHPHSTLNTLNRKCGFFRSGTFFKLCHDVSFSITLSWML